MAGEYLTNDKLYGKQEDAKSVILQKTQLISGGEIYNYNTWELIIPSPIIFYQLSTGRDKTSLFLISLCRIILYVFLLKYCYDDIDNNILNNIIIFIIFINCLYLLTIMTMQPINI
jgi:hypothetical protein